MLNAVGFNKKWVLGCALLHLSHCGSLYCGDCGCAWGSWQVLAQTSCGNTQTSLLGANGKPSTVQKSCLPFHSLGLLFLKVALVCCLMSVELTGDGTRELLSSVSMTTEVFPVHFDSLPGWQHS